MPVAYCLAPPPPSQPLAASSCSLQSIRLLHVQLRLCSSQRSSVVFRAASRQEQTAKTVAETLTHSLSDTTAAVHRSNGQPPLRVVHLFYFFFFFFFVVLSSSFPSSSLTAFCNLPSSRRRTALFTAAAASAIHCRLLLSHLHLHQQHIPSFLSFSPSISLHFTAPNCRPIGTATTTATRGSATMFFRCVEQSK